MRVPTRRMNDFWGRMSFTLLICAFLLHGGLCQDDATDAPAVTDPMRGDGDPIATTAPPEDPQTPIEIAVPTDLSAPGDVDTDGTSATAAPDTTADDTGASDMTGDTAATAAPDTDATAAPAGVTAAEDATQTAVMDTHLGFTVLSDLSGLFPDDSKDTKATEAPAVAVTESADPVVLVNCVTQDEVKDRAMVKLELETVMDCESIKKVVEEHFCKDRKVCKVSIAQDGEKVMLSGPTIEENVAEAAQMFQGGEMKEKLVVLNSEPVAKQSSAVLVAILVTGLLLAAILIGGYLRINHCKGNGKGMRLAEDSYPVDEENQGNTLVSVAPLNPPEPQEKPSINGESPDGVKTQAPAATNGHSTAKTPVADTEL